MPSFFETFDALHKRSHQLLAIAVTLLVMGLIGADVVHSIWVRKTPAPAQQSAPQPPSPDNGCKSMPDGMRICGNPPPITPLDRKDTVQ